MFFFQIRYNLVALGSRPTMGLCLYSELYCILLLSCCLLVYQFCTFLSGPMCLCCGFICLAEKLWSVLGWNLFMLTIKQPIKFLNKLPMIQPVQKHKNCACHVAIHFYTAATRVDDTIRARSNS